MDIKLSNYAASTVNWYLGWGDLSSDSVIFLKGTFPLIKRLCD